MNSLMSVLVPIGSALIIFCVIHWVVLQERRKNKFSPFTEKSLRSPGYSLGKALDDSMDRMLLPVITMYLIPTFFAFFVNLSQLHYPLIFLFCVAGVLLYFAKQFSTRSSEARKIMLGLEGEVYTGQELNYLMRDGAYVFHDVPYKYGNIDHIVVSTGGVFVIETKAIRKSAGVDGKRQSRVLLKDGKLNFPGFTTDYPLKQALRHAKYMRDFLKSKTANNIEVTPVVALPGWFIDIAEKHECLIINPKRGKALQSYVKRSIIDASRVDIIANLIEDIARSVWSDVEKFNPDAADKFTLTFDRKPEERRIE